MDGHDVHAHVNARYSSNAYARRICETKGVRFLFFSIRPVETSNSWLYGDEDLQNSPDPTMLIPSAMCRKHPSSTPTAAFLQFIVNSYEQVLEQPSIVIYLVEYTNPPPSQQHSMIVCELQWWLIRSYKVRTLSNSTGRTTIHAETLPPSLT